MIPHNVQNVLKAAPHRIFAIDGAGAIVSALFLGIILPGFADHIGLPVRALHLLALIAVLFAIYSISCFVVKPERWQRYLAGIALANSIYCLFTIGVLFQYRSDLTFLGYTYFIIEILIVLYLVQVELSLTRTQ